MMSRGGSPTHGSGAKTLLALIAAALCWLLSAAAAPALADGIEPVADPFAVPEVVEKLSAEIEFFRVESDIVTTVSRHAESLWGAGAAVYVVTGEEIRLSGAQTIPEALRMVPGLDVAAIDHNNTAISARGLNNAFADKMLVLLDGRPIYTPLFGGTIWHQWNTFLPDVDRIEVIRGPGGTLWGANAMNGVINIITKSSEETHGGLLRGEAGSNYQLLGEGRWGGEFENFNYRAWARGAQSEGFGGNGGKKIKDDNSETRAGYRFDWNLGKGLLLLSTFEYYSSRLGSINRSFDATGSISNEELFDDKWGTELYTTLWRMEKDFANGSSAHFQLAGDYVAQDAPFLTAHPQAPLPPSLTDRFSTIRRSIEAELQHSVRLFDRHRVTWGANYRATNIDVNDSLLLAFPVREDNLNVAGGFIQDEITLWKGSRLTLGTKVEYNTFTDTNVQPSARFVQLFGEDTSVWASISRAVNTPSYGDKFVTFATPPDLAPPGVTPVFTADRQVNPDPTNSVGSIDDTELIAYELGIRQRLGEGLTIDVSGFYNDYDGIMSFSGNTLRTDCNPLAPAPCTVATYLDNAQDGESYGIEAIANMRLAPWLKGEVNGTWQEFDLDGSATGSAPEWKFNFRAFLDPLPGLTVVPSIHVVDDVKINSIFGEGAGSTKIGDYTRVDLAVHYRYAEGWPTVSFVGQNLNDRKHKEFEEETIRPASPVTRSWFFRIEQEF